MLGIRASSGTASGGGGGAGFVSMAALFSGGEKGAYYDFTDATKLAINADGTGGSPALDGAAKWAVDQSPNANHLRNTVGSVIRRANGVETRGDGNYGLFNSSGSGDWPDIPQPFMFVATLEQINFAGADQRIVGDSASSWLLLQGPDSGKVRHFAGAYGSDVNPGLGAEFTIDILSNGASSAVGYNGAASVASGGGNAAMIDVFLGSGSGGTGPQIRFKRILFISRPLTSGERTGVLAWASA